MTISLLLVALVSVDSPAASPAPRSRQETILVRQDCQSTLGRREVTLFANGTIRLREESGDERASIRLGELGQEELDAVLRRFAEIDFSEDDAAYLAPDGEWTESCRFELAFDRESARTFAYSRYASLPLSLASALRIVDDLAGQVLPALADRQLPDGYRPQVGDLLVRIDGARFVVVAFTSDGKGVELQGEEQPLTVFLTPDELRRQFVGVEADPRRR